MTNRPTGGTFDDWETRAKAARDELITQWRTEREAAARDGRPFSWKPKINDKLYKELRQVFLFEAFLNKCAYCEADNSANYPVQVEHYRPKSEVTENRRPINHPGYFWLAYEWWNLLLSCASCNTDHTDPRRRLTEPGKKNEFPVSLPRSNEPSDNADQWHIELAAEGPILLNPYFDRPEEHIDFDPATGDAVAAKNGAGLSPRGKATIEICDLNRPSLCERRRDLRMDALDGMVLKIMNGQDLDSVVPPCKEFSVWRRRLIRHRLTEMCSRIGLIVTGVSADRS